MIYFSSDWHMNHKNIINYEPTRQIWGSVEEMNEGLITNYNNVVTDEDTCYFLGDMSFGGKQKTAEQFSRLNGHKILVKGNHDQFPDEFYKQYFELVVPYYELLYENVFFILFHYPIDEWNGKFRDSIHLHGHMHSKGFPYRNRYNVCVEVTGLKPISIEEILAKRKFYE